MNTGPRTIVHLLDYDGIAGNDKPLPHKVFRVLVNGQEVRLARDGVKITFGENQATEVTLTLQPDEVHFQRS